MTTTSPARNATPTATASTRSVSSARPSSWTRLALVLAGRAILRPRLALDLCRVAWHFRARGWQTRFPFLPLPPAEYVRWRMHTAYGDPDAVPPAEDVVRYARWVAGRH